MNLCKDCKYHTFTNLLDYRCFHSNANIADSPVDGRARRLYSGYCEEIRKDERFCGPDGKWFEAKAMVPK
jgi:hypothetical protein